MKITVFIFITLLLVVVIIRFFPFDKGVVESKDEAAPLLPNLICFPKSQFGGEFKSIKNRIEKVGGQLWPIPGNKLCFEIVPETYVNIRKWGYDVEVLR